MRGSVGGWGAIDLAELAVHPEGAEGDEGGDESFDGGAGADAMIFPGLEDGVEEEDAESAVGDAADADGEGQAGVVFEGHGDAKEDEVGDPFEDADVAKRPEGGVR